ncbi:two-component system response regulator [Geothermobacter hydrogeniphilus]|uniref:Two-component system response regulator n=1 Tax=Geothermobacter hydrogeniphilus TaxID=1969733 RepID=A0A2K2HAR9_9BACT|nr:TIGR02266 family protein [Geothermobacter hydrogeniphilus]PNU20329.1 two-component system response regulator [Geothermobacter hydrogeniphilus]
MERKKVLLADDVELFLELEKTFFRREQVDLLIARNGVEAVELARREKPHLIFMDLFMPEMNGDAACRAIKADPELADIPLLMVTHGGREADLERCRAAGCDDLLLKPINRHQFVDAASRYLRLSERQAPRVDARLQVRYGEGLERELTDYSLNISTGGVFLETTNPLPPGSPLSLEFNLPQRSEPIVSQARVAWINDPKRITKPHLPPGMGVQFLDLSLADLQAVRDFVQTAFCKT